MRLGLICAAACAVLHAAPALAQITTTADTDASQFASRLAGSGVTFTSASLAGDAEAGFFNNGLAATGINSGVILTTGGLGCAGAANLDTACTAGGDATSSVLTLGFRATSTSLSFNYVFASEEYNEFVDLNLPGCRTGARCRSTPSTSTPTRPSSATTRTAPCRSSMTA